MSKKIEVKYAIEGNSSLVIIRNDNRVRVYIELKKSFSGFLNYPLCITTFDKSNKEIDFDRETGVVLCVEGTKSDAFVECALFSYKFTNR